MTEQLKFVVKELNMKMGTNYDLIKFDSLNDIQLLQILVDILVFLGAGEKVNVESEEPEAISVTLLDMLRNVKYKPPSNTDMASFRKKLLIGEKSTVLTVLQWLLKNIDQSKKTAYLAKYLKKPEIPPDIVANADMADTLDMYDKLAVEFKEAHKLSLQYSDEDTKEIIGDMQEIAVERDVVIKRLEAAYLKLADTPNKENLLNISRTLRLQQERAKDLELHYKEQQDQLKKVGDHLQRNLGSFRGQAPAKSVDDLIQRLTEELQVNEYLVKEKQPAELNEVQKDLSVLQFVYAQDNVNRQDLISVQEKMDIVNREIETMIQRKLLNADPQEDKLGPFRQQATTIKRNKQLIAEKLHELTNNLRSLENILSDKQSQVQQLLGDTVLRGEELKKYVNKLRSKSITYKHQRAALSSQKIETGVLNRSMEILHLRDPTLEVALLNHKKLKVDIDNVEDELKGTSDLRKRSLHELSQMLSHLAQTLDEIKQEVAPLLSQIQPVKEEFQQLQQQLEQKKRIYDSASISLTSQMEPLEKEANDLRKKITLKEEEWKILRQKIEKAEHLLYIINQETKIPYSSTGSPKKFSQIEITQNQILEQQKLAISLKEEQKWISERQSVVVEQTQLFTQLLQLLNIKIQCMEESAPKQGSLTITSQAQMLTL